MMPDLQRVGAERLAAYASPFAQLALANIVCPYPNHPGHVLLSASDLADPKTLHPVFYGSYDWHSAVHMHWLLVTLLSRFPAISEADEIQRQLSNHFTSENLKTEAHYFLQPANRTFERTYGWAWLLKLQATLISTRAGHASIGAWRHRLQPLADLIAQRYLDFFPLAQYPIRAGVHGNSAFGLLFALEYARTAEHSALADAVISKALEWFGGDHRYPAHYEPGGDDFLSGGLIEAVLMRQILGSDRFACWWNDFCPDAAALETWLVPVRATDPSDPKLAHLDGLNLARAWCWAMLHPVLPAPLAPTALSAVDRHLAASLPGTIAGHYAGTHWLASFALLALLALVETE
jgi:hypothetical protein